MSRRPGPPGAGRRNRWRRWRGVPAVVACGALAGSLAGCTPADRIGPPSARVSTWVHEAQLGQSVGTVLGDAARVTAAVRDHKSTSVMHTICAVLLDDVEAANSNLPTPDQRLTTLLSDAYGTEGDAANDCFDAGAGNPRLQAKSARERSRARSLLLRALARVEAVTGHPLSTTTTIPPGGGGIFG